ncbi:MAG TPA: LON peptidase substrate-binding domain-containing protein, partial [Ktedonobacterales bacterium]|nr:LON peptidase substrate-binding domain-containing protein [Ktedonobacterales bacterium]
MHDDAVGREQDAQGSGAKGSLARKWLPSAAEVVWLAGATRTRAAGAGETDESPASGDIGPAGTDADADRSPAPAGERPPERERPPDAPTEPAPLPDQMPPPTRDSDTPTPDPSGASELPPGEPEAPRDAASDQHDADEEDERDESEATAFELPDTLPILPLKDTVVYPFAVVPLGVGKDRSKRLIDDAMRGARLVGLVAQKDADIEHAGPADCFRIGTVARIARLLRMPDGTIQVIVQGLDRIAIEDYTEEDPFLRAHVRLAPETTESDTETEALKRNAIVLFQRMVSLVQYLPNELAVNALNLDDAREVVYLIASSVQMELELRQQLLELDSVRAKLEKITPFLNRELEVLELGKKIQSQAQEEMGKAQREYFLREQLKAIQKELGEESDEAATINQLRDKIAEAHLPEEAAKEAQRELARLEKLPA